MKIKLIVGIMLLVWAVLLSGLAGLVSIIGMVALFPAGGLTIVGIMTLLESSKLLIAGWTHANWKNKLVPRWLKAYMVSAVITLMAITGMGVYGFMTKAHIEQNSPSAAVQIDIDQKETALDQLVTQRDQLQTQQTQINSTVASYLEGGRASGASTFIRQQRAEQARIQAEVRDLNDQITAGNVELAPLRREMAGSEAKLGPLKATAEALGLKDAEGAVRIIILMLMWCFDPLAVCTMIAGTIVIGEYLRMRRERPVEVAAEEPIESEETPIVEEILEDGPVADTTQDEEALPENWLDWREADSVVGGPEIRAEHEANLDPIIMALPRVLPLPEVDPALLAQTEPLEALRFDDIIVSSPKPKFGGISEPIPNLFGNVVQEPVDASPEKQDNTAVLISILENDPTLMADLIEAITTTPRVSEVEESTPEPVSEPVPEPIVEEPRRRMWLEPRTKGE